MGSGVIVSQDGYILTNHHVIDGASQVEVLLSDRRELPAKVIGSDSKTDIAVLKVEAKDLPVLSFGNSDNVKVGDIVLAIGNPFGVGQTVTMGIVGATGRGNLGIEDYEDFIQTDAAINPGNSGGALIDTQGALVGINTAILSNGSRGNQGIGFAVPINLAHHVMAQLLEHGSVVRGFLGIGIQDLTPAMSKAFGAPDHRGALVRSVEPGSPGQEAGLQKGDIVRELNGKPVEGSRELKLAVAAMAPGTNVDLGVWHDGRMREVSVKLATLKDEQAQAAESSGETSVLDGVQVDELSPQIARQLGLSPSTRGVVVSSVRGGSAADEAGLQRGDVIEEVARKPVSSVAEFQQALRGIGDNDVLLLVNRGGSSLFLVIEPR
jgi:serine protease Do